MMRMAKNKAIQVRGTEITVVQGEQSDSISLYNSNFKGCTTLLQSHCRAKAHEACS